MSNEGIIVDALLKTDPALYQSIDAGNSFKAAIAKRGARVAKYRRYASGDHDATLTTQMRKMLRLNEDAAGLNAMNINYMGIVVDKMAGRLNVDCVETELEDETENANAKMYLENILIDNDFESIQGMIYRGAIRDGDSYVMVDPVTSKWSVEPAYDGFSGMFAIMRQGQDYPQWACKLYSYADLDLTGDEPASNVTMKVIVYQPNKISYFVSESSGQSVEIDKTEKVKPWAMGKIPIVHFANLKDSYTQFGESEIRKGIAPQDVLNRTLHSMVMASEFSAFKIVWSIGLEVDKSGITPGDVINLLLIGADGNVISNPTAEQIELLKAVRVGEFAESDISQYTGQIEKLVIQISHVTSTPIYGVTAQGNISGEALKQLETGLIGKCQRFQKENTGAVRALIEMTAAIQKNFAGFKDPPQLGRITVEWDSPELRDNVIDKEIQEKKIAWETAANVYSASNGQIPVEAVLKTFGFTEDEMSEFGTQKLAAIALEQEDVVPDTGL